MMTTDTSNETPLPNDGMTAETSPGQQAAQAESWAREAEPASGEARSAGEGTEPGAGTDDVTPLSGGDTDDNIDESDEGLPLGNAPLAGGEE